MSEEPEDDFQSLIRSGAKQCMLCKSPASHIAILSTFDMRPDEPLENQVIHFYGVCAACNQLPDVAFRLKAAFVSNLAEEEELKN